MTSALDDIPGDELGERLRIARESVKLTQAGAAAGIKVARTTLVAMEQGQRRIRIDELQQLAKLYKTSVNAILRHEAIFTDLAPKFRKRGHDNRRRVRIESLQGLNPYQIPHLGRNAGAGG